MSQPTTWPTWLAALFVTSLFSFCMGYSLHWAISRDDARSGNVVEAAPDSESRPQTASTAQGDASDVRAARHFFVAVSGLFVTPETRLLMAELQPGGVVLRAENIQSPAQVLQLVRDLKEAAGSTTQRLSDAPIVMLHDPADAAQRLSWDTAMARSFAGAFPDAALAAQSAQGLAQACAQMGIAVVFGPTLAQQASMLRSFGNTAPAGASLSVTASAYTQGMVDGGVLPVVKYFPRGSDSTSFGAAAGGVSQLAEAMLPFEEAVAQGAPGILVGHSPVPELDPSHPDRPASQSQLMVNDLLRGRWGFNGVVIADDITRRAATGSRSVEATAIETFKAGCDAVVFLDPAPGRIRAACAAVDSAVGDGLIDPRALASAVRRIEVWQTWLDRPLPAPVAAAPQPANSMLARSYPADEVDRVNLDAQERVPPDASMPVTLPQPTPALSDWVEPVAATPVELDAPGPVAEMPVTEAPTEDVSTGAAPAEEVPDEEATVETGADVAAELTPTETAASEPDAAAESSDAEPAPSDEAATTEEAEVDTVEAPVEYEPAPASEEANESVPEEMAVASLPPDEAEASPELLPEPVETENEEAPAEEEVTAEPEDAAPTIEAPASDPVEETAAPETGETVHIVVPGDTLSGVAAQYDVTIDDIMRWNALEKKQINLGAKLLIRPSTEVESETPAQEQAATPAEVAQEAAAEPAEIETAAAEFDTHEIKPGDTLTRIARMYGVTQDELLELNGLDNPNQILIGQKLRVPR